MCIVVQVVTSILMFIGPLKISTKQLIIVEKKLGLKTG